LPDLPRLPEFPKLDDEESRKLHQLPSFPSNSFGTKFSQDTIKEAVTGKKEGFEADADEFGDEDEIRMMREPLKKPLTEEIGDEISERFERERNVAEPVFIRVDRFEEALKVFGQTKRKISEIERILGDIKKLKEKEDKELQSWENEVRPMRGQIEKIDRDIFSKI
jgi:hypothetical protein